MKNGIPKKTAKELERLFLFSSPKKLRKSIGFIFFQYLSATPPDVLPRNFQRVAEDVYFLMDFLEKARKRQKTQKRKKTH